MLKRWHTLRANLHPLARRLSQDPTYRLQSYGEVALAAELGFTIDVNRATVDDWLRLPGFSIRQAQRLERLRRGGIQFYCLEDIAAALEIGTALLQPLLPVLAFRHYDLDQAGLPRINLNLANIDQLNYLPEMTPQLAQTIVQERDRRGAYHDLADLQGRLGLPPELIQAWVYYLYS